MDNKEIALELTKLAVGTNQRILNGEQATQFVTESFKMCYEAVVTVRAPGA